VSYGKKRGLWRGLKQIFHGGRQGSVMRPANRSGRLSGGGGTTAPNQRRSMSRSDMQSLSYSCLGQPCRREEEEEEEGEEEYAEQYHMLEEQARRLSRNLSLSHESVFRIDSHTGQVSRKIFNLICYPSQQFNAILS
jgi:hypothetical protein